MPVGRYTRPPITEAVIEFRFGGSTSDRVMNSFVRSVRNTYPAVEALYEISVQFETAAPGSKPTVGSKQTLSGYKATDREGTDLIILNAGRLGTVRLAPYCGWDAFLEKARRNYASFKKITGFQKIVRVATRYINRLDIPRAGRESVDPNDYAMLEPRVPGIIPNVHGFTTQFLGDVPAVNGRVLINAGTVVSPLIDHVSLLLDIDLFVEQNLPQRDSEIWELLAALRYQKNAIFEAFITDRARELFDRD